jgi:hypothetical protein
MSSAGGGNTGMQKPDLMTNRVIAKTCVCARWAKMVENDRSFWQQHHIIPSL